MANLCDTHFIGAVSTPVDTLVAARSANEFTARRTSSVLALAPRWSCP